MKQFSTCKINFIRKLIQYSLFYILLVLILYFTFVERLLEAEVYLETGINQSFVQFPNNYEAVVQQIMYNNFNSPLERRYSEQFTLTSILKYILHTHIFREWIINFQCHINDNDSSYANTFLILSKTQKVVPLSQYNQFIITSLNIYINAINFAQNDQKITYAVNVYQLLAITKQFLYVQLTKNVLIQDYAFLIAQLILQAEKNDCAYKTLENLFHDSHLYNRLLLTGFQQKIETLLLLLFSFYFFSKCRIAQQIFKLQWNSLQNCFSFEQGIYFYSKVSNLCHQFRNFDDINISTLYLIQIFLFLFGFFLIIFLYKIQMKIIFSFIFCSVVFTLQKNYWEEISNYQLSEGTNVHCLPLTEAYQPVCNSSSCSLGFTLNLENGYTRIAYTFNLYYQFGSQYTFQENGQTISQNLLLQEQNQGAFSYCSNNFQVHYIKLQSLFAQNNETIQFLITNNKATQFIMTTLKIYIHRCNIYCKKCLNEVECSECLPSFSLTSYQQCQCMNNLSPYVYQNQCVSNCPIGFYAEQIYCKPYKNFETIFTDNSALQFEFIKDFNTTNRVTRFIEAGVVYAGLFVQNEYIQYLLPQTITEMVDIYFQFEIYILNFNNFAYLSIKFDDYTIYKATLNRNYLVETNSSYDGNGIFGSCSLFQDVKCVKYSYNNLFKTISNLKKITICLNLPLNDFNASWAMRDFGLFKLELLPKLPCLKKNYNGDCIEECPALTKEIGQNCESLTKEFPFTFIKNESFTNNSKFNEIQLIDQIGYLQYKKPLNFYQFYQNQYIFGGHQIWRTEQYIFDQYIDGKSSAHYKVKIYIKIILIDPQNDLDSLTIYLENNQYIITQNHQNSTCQNNLGSGICLKREDIGTSATDYIVKFEAEIDHYSSKLQLRMKCNANSIDFYCAFFDFIILVAQCPMYCLKCSSSTNCIFEQNTTTAELSQIYYYQNGMSFSCPNYCKQCNEKQCLVCKDNYEQIDNQCFCKLNLVIAGYTDCKEYCGGMCSDCLKSNECLSCNIEQKKVQSGLECVCIDGYYVDKSTVPYSCQECNKTCKTCNEGQNCLTCNANQNREIYDNKCICKEGFFEFEPQDFNCYSCSSNCKTCFNSIDQCTSCYFNLFRVLSNFNTCKCQKGYYEDENKICLKCDHKCETCLDFNVCLSCDIYQFRDLNNELQCECKQNYYENENEKCLQCYYTCSKCKQKNYLNSCTECPQTRIRNSNLLDSFECLCKKGFYDVGDLECISCSDLINPPLNHYCYSKCGDLIVQWNEECDDGNLNSRDECDQCYFPISSCSNHPKCTNCQQNKCIECIEGYYLNIENICEQCSEQCLTCSFSKYNCNECKYKNGQNNNCLSCSLSEGYQDIDGKCYSICGDGIKTQEEECDDGNLLNGDGCNRSCAIEQGFICQQSCIANSIFIILKENENDSVYNSKRQILLFFNSLVRIESDKLLKDIISVEPVKSNLKIKNIEIIDNTHYSDKFNQIEMFISFEFEASQINPKIQITIQNNTLIENQSEEYLQKFTEIIQVIDCIIETENTSQVLQNIATIINCLLYLIIGLVISTLFLGGLENFTSFFDTLQFIGYLKYINITFPYNVEKYLQIFNFTEIRIFENFSKLVNDEYGQSRPPFKFQIQGYSTIFIFNTFSVFIIFSTLFFFQYILKLLMYFISKLIHLRKKNHKVKSTFIKKSQLLILKLFYKLYKIIVLYTYRFPKIIFQTFMICQLNLNLAQFLQIQDIQLNSFWIFLNYILFIFCLAGQVLLLFQKIQLNPEKQQLNQKSLGHDLNLNEHRSFYVKYIIIRKILLSGFLVLLYNFSQYQIASILSLNLFSLVITFRIFRFIKIKQFIVEIIFTLSLLLILLIDFSQQKNLNNLSNIEFVGWLIIIFLNIAILLEFIFNVQKYIRYILDKYHVFQKVNQIVHQFLSEITESEEELIYE